MLAIPSALQAQFEEYLRNKAIPNSLQGAYKKWLRYYLDFCQKYHFPPIHKDSLPHFIRKLQEKKQTKIQQKHFSIREATGRPIQYEKVIPPLSRDSAPSLSAYSSSHTVSPSGKASAEPQNVIASASVQTKRGNGASWKAEYSRLADEIHVRHYSSNAPGEL